jgi:hypothetical protein
MFGHCLITLLLPLFGVSIIWQRAEHNRQEADRP